MNIGRRIGFGFLIIAAGCCFEARFALGEREGLNDVEKDMAARSARFQKHAGISHIPVIPDGLTTPPRLRFDRQFQRGANCGPNAAFVMLRANGVVCTLEEVSRLIPVGDRGASLGDLKRAMEHFGLICEIRKQVSPADLMTTPEWCIVHLKSFGAGPQETESLDHFAVLAGYIRDLERFRGVDTVSLVSADFSPRLLVRQMSGYVLFVVGREGVPSRKTGGHWIWGSVIVIVILTNAAVFLYAWRRRLSM